MLDLYAPLLAAPLCIAACYMSFTGYKLVQRDGAWPSGLLCAVAVWIFICIRVAFWDHRKARIGVHIFGMGKSEDLVHFIDDFDSWWPPMMGTVLLFWGMFVRFNLVQAWPPPTERFSWERLFYIVDALVFYCAVLLWSEASNGWLALVLCAGASAWAFYQRDSTLILRLPVMCVVFFLVFEHYNDMDLGTMAFFASSVASVAIGIGTGFRFATQDDQQPHLREDGRPKDNSAGLVDATLLWGILLAFLDSKAGVTKGVMAFVFVVLLLPGLHVRGYPLPLAGTPLVIPLSFMYMLWSLEVEGDTEPELVAAIAGWIISSILIVLSLVQLTPTIAGDASEFKSLGVTMKNHAYHRFLFWAGSGWMYLWTVIGLYATAISIPGSLCIQILIGVVCLVLGIQKDSMLLRMSGLVELCAAILLGAFIDTLRALCKSSSSW